MLFDKVVIVGIGLIGSSLARNLKKHRLARKVAAFDKNPAYLAEASELGIVDEVFDEPGCGGRCGFNRFGNAGGRFWRINGRDGSLYEKGSDFDRRRFGEKICLAGN